MNIVILGSTGSIGTQTLELLKDHTEYKVLALSAGENISLLEEQAREWKPKYLCVFHEDKARLLKERFSSSYNRDDTLHSESVENRTPYRKKESEKDSYSPVIYSGMEGLIQLSALEEADMIVISVVGMVGIQPTISAIQAGKKIALANKETLVCAGHLINDLLKESKAKLFPIDSEHSAIWQCLRGEKAEEVEKLILTASGGPFFGLTKDEMKEKKKEDALKHPNWSMGRKITIDSATMVNKALEVLEAHILFHIPIEKIQVVIQRESIIHSAVQFRDGAIKAELGVPTMRVPIAYAVFEEEREDFKGEKLDFTKVMSLHFYPPSYTDFPALALGRSAGLKGGSMTTVFNAANEEAVSLFLQDKISFLSIPALIERAMQLHEKDWKDYPSVEEILSIEQWARNCVEENANQVEA
ncbi:1-deoxy-D-xylulose-5-phosphate reductoisomerase [Oribacterium asaccharolyticum]|uniref:1-deoxy-D-xylulose-5-phosphate reductoisomerase n=1 Tax=Oribacterium asaccharolyticum TaxID=1501332 RepID=UPI0028F0D4C3|nr:1-deoxy-D-xylulose-5-phosphate reductoisomerase [Oribacterium asaccharolyticum]